MKNGNAQRDTPTDETIMAYLDGELDQAAVLAFEIAIHADSTLRSKLEKFKQNDAALIGSLQTISETSPPPIIKPAGTENKDSLLWLKSWCHGFSLSAFGFPLTKPALGYSFVLLGLGILIGNTFPLLNKGYINNKQTFEQMQIVSAAINMALERKASGTLYEWSNPYMNIYGKVTPLKTWKQSDNQYCRAFELEWTKNQQSSLRQAIACRKSEGYWKPEPPLEMYL